MLIKIYPENPNEHPYNFIQLWSVFMMVELLFILLTLYMDWDVILQSRRLSKGLQLSEA